MRYIVFLLFLSYVVFGFSQKKEKYTFYLIGRPNSFEKNNALKEVQGNWKLRHVSVGSDVYADGLDSLIQENKKTDILLRNKFGDDWHSLLMKETEEKLLQHTEIRSLIKLRYAVLLSEIKNAQIEIDDRNKRKAIIRIFGTESIGKQNIYFTYHKLKLNKKRMIAKKVSSVKNLIDFSYPQNDIINK